MLLRGGLKIAFSQHRSPPPCDTQKSSGPTSTNAMDSFIPKKQLLRYLLRAFEILPTCILVFIVVTKLSGEGEQKRWGENNLFLGGKNCKVQMENGQNKTRNG